MTEIRPADRRDIPILIELLAAQLSEPGLAAGREQIRRGIEVAFEAGAPLLFAREGLRAVGACLANSSPASNMVARSMKVTNRRARCIAAWFRAERANALGALSAGSPERHRARRALQPSGFEEEAEHRENDERDLRLQDLKSKRRGAVDGESDQPRGRDRDRD